MVERFQGARHPEANQAMPDPVKNGLSRGDWRLTHIDAPGQVLACGGIGIERPAGDDVSGAHRRS